MDFENFIYDTLSGALDCPRGQQGAIQWFMAHHLNEWCDDNCGECNMRECWRKFFETKYNADKNPAKQIKVKYHDATLAKIEKRDMGDWIDLRAAENVTLKAGEYGLISLGVSMELPEGYEAHIVPRSSTFKTWSIIQTDHMAVIDNSYSGDDDVWLFPALALRDTEIKKNDRICQFRIVKKQPPLEFVEVDKLGDRSRGGFGSTGTN